MPMDTMLWTRPGSLLWLLPGAELAAAPPHGVAALVEPPVQWCTVGNCGNDAALGDSVLQGWGSASARGADGDGEILGAAALPDEGPAMATTAGSVARWP